MKKAIYIPILFLLLPFQCKKDTKTPEPEPLPEPPKTPTAKFIFVNRLGFRKDSTKHGTIDTVMAGVCLDLKYFDKPSNISHVDGTCFNRNMESNNFPLSDSIVFKNYAATVGNEFVYQIELVWNRPVYPYPTRVLRFNTKNYSKSDTIKTAKDTIIKFIWPIDTSSGRFVKTYSWP